MMAVSPIRTLLRFVAEVLGLPSLRRRRVEVSDEPEPPHRPSVDVWEPKRPQPGGRDAAAAVEEPDEPPEVTVTGSALPTMSGDNSRPPSKRLSARVQSRAQLAKLRAKHGHDWLRNVVTKDLAKTQGGDKAAATK